MPDDHSFRDLIRRIRAGDGPAAEELVGVYGPTLLAMARRQILDPALRRHFDSKDIRQSVLGSLLVRIRLGQYQLDTPQDLERLLARLVRNKVADQARKRKRFPRPLPADGDGDFGGREPADPGPGHRAANKDLLDESQRRMSEEEWQIIDLRAQGHSWAEIAAAVGGTPDAVRVRHGRTVTRVRAEVARD